MKASTPIKMLIFTHYSAYYGANRSLVDLLLGLRQLNYGLKVIAPSEGEFTEVLQKQNLDYEVVPFYPSIYSTTRLSFFLKKKRYKKNTQSLDILKSIVKDFAPDYIYTNSSVMDLGFRLAKLTQTPHIWHIREMAELHYGYKFYPSKAAFVNALKESALIIPISQAIANAVLIPNQVTNYKVLFDAVFAQKDFDELDFKSSPQKSNFVFTTIGFLHPSKHQAEIIKAFRAVEKKHPNAELWIVGNGQLLYTLYLKFLILFFGLSKKVKLLGYLSDISKIYSDSDAIIMASEHEGLGRCTIEGMAYQKPVIGYASGATVELIDHGKRGLLYTDHSIGLAEAMEELINNPELAQQLGENGRQYVSKNFITAEYITQFNNIISAVK
ncbi:MAG: glycosyltransferase family 4 protein [Aureispira sp.]|nr:glycosyltransferase family 4 protein [Aureispira sp.]